MVAIGSKVYFPAYDGVNGIEVWESDGTTAGTKMIQDLWPGQQGGGGILGTAAGILYIPASDGLHGNELFRFVP